MRKTKRWLAGALAVIFVFTGCLAFGGKTAYAATDKTDNTIVVNNDTVVPSKYSFIFRWIDGKTTAQTFNFGQGSFDSTKTTPDLYHGYGGTNYMYHLKSRNDLGKFGIMYHNVGTYRGKTIDLKITITDYDPRNPSGGIQFSEGIISLDTQDMAFVKQRWDFYDAKTNEKVKINGYVTINDIDWTQGVTFDSETSKHIQNVLVTKDTIVDVKKSNGEIAVQDSGLHKDIDPMTKKGWATVLFNDADNLTFKWCVHDLDSKPYQCHEPEKAKWEGRWDGDYFGYTEKKLARTEIITPEKYIQSNGNKVTEKTITSDDGVEYSLLHKVPDETSDFYYGSYKLKDEVPDCLKIKSYGIYDETGKNVSSYFNNKTNGNKIRYETKKEILSKADFYGHDYYVRFKAMIDQTKLDKYLVQNEAQIKNSFTVTVDGKSEKSNETVVKVPRRTLIIRHIDEITGQLLRQDTEKLYDGEKYSYKARKDLKDSQGHAYCSSMKGNGVINGKDVTITIPYHVASMTANVDSIAIETDKAGSNGLPTAIRWSASEKYHDDFEGKVAFKINVTDTNTNKTVLSKQINLKNEKARSQNDTEQTFEGKIDTTLPSNYLVKGQKANYKVTVSFDHNDNPYNIITNTTTNKMTTYGYAASEKTITNNDLDARGNVTYSPVMYTVRYLNSNTVSEYRETYKVSSFMKAQRQKTGYSVELNAPLEYDYNRNTNAEKVLPDNSRIKAHAQLPQSPMHNVNDLQNAQTQMNMNAYRKSDIQLNAYVPKKLMDSRMNETFEMAGDKFYKVPLTHSTDDYYFNGESITPTTANKYQYNAIVNHAVNFKYPKANVEKKTGHLYTDDQVAAKKPKYETINGGNKLYIPVWSDLGNYNIDLMSNQAGINYVTFRLTKNINVYAYMYATMGSETGKQDELLLEPVYPDSGRPKGWTKSELEWLEK